jgi:low affinity Fe/Cu permease
MKRVHERAADAKREEETESVSDVFRHVAGGASEKFGSHWAFIAALSIIIGWASSGPFFGFSETWQLVINTGTTIITFLMVFLIQSTQNRDAKAIHLKLDELIRASEARNVFADLENATEAELETFQREFAQLHAEGKRGVKAVSEAHERALRQRDRPGRREKAPR